MISSKFWSRWVRETLDIVPLKNVEFPDLWLPSSILAESENVVYLANRKRWSDFEQIVDPRGISDLRYGASEKKVEFHEFWPPS